MHFFYLFLVVEGNRPWPDEDTSSNADSNVTSSASTDSTSNTTVKFIKFYAPIAGGVAGFIVLTVAAVITMIVVVRICCIHHRKKKYVVKSLWTEKVYGFQ